MPSSRYYVYVLECMENGWMYIGKGAGDRMQYHFLPLNVRQDVSKDRPLYKDIERYGKNKFDKWIVEYYSTAAEAYAAERDWIRHLKNMGINLYNKTSGDIGRGQSKILTVENEQSICDEYSTIENMTIRGLGRKYGCSSDKVRTILELYGIQKKPSGNRKGSQLPVLHKFDSETQLEICRKYRDDWQKIGEIAKIYNCYGSNIRDVLARHKIHLYTKIERLQHLFSESVCLDIKNKYLTNISICKLAKEYKCLKSDIHWVLNKCNIKRRRYIVKGQGIGPAQKFNKEIQSNICKKYKEEFITVKELATLYDCKLYNISNILDRYSIKRHTSEEILEHRFSELIRLTICYRYTMGEVMDVLRKEYGCWGKAMSWMLDQYGIPKRLSGRQSPEKRKKENDELKTYSKELEEKIDKLKGK